MSNSISSVYDIECQGMPFFMQLLNCTSICIDEIDFVKYLLYFVV